MTWKTVKLGEVCEVDWGNTSLTKKAYIKDGEYLAVSATGGDGRINHYEHAENVCVLSAIGAQCGKMFFPEQKFTAIKNTITFTPKSELVFGRFLYYLLTNVELPKRGAAQPFISKGDIQSFVVSYPPLAEQERIVAKLDAAFAAIDQGIALAEKKEAEVEQLKAALLSASLAGDDWKTVKLGEVCELKNGFAFKSSKFRAEGTPILRISNIQDGSITLKKIVYACQADYTEDLEKYRVSEGALLIAMSGATTGKVGINTTKNSFYLNQRVGMFKPTNALDRDYLYYLLSTKVEENLSISAGAAQPNLSTKQINSITFPLPPLAEQERIVAKLDAAFAELETARTAIAETKANYQALKAAILAQELQPKENAAA